jgi:hypothetical protein
MAWAWQYRHPLALLDTHAIIRLSADVTRPSLAITALFRLMKALEIAGRRCMVSTEFGQNPSVSLKNRANLRVSGSWSVLKGVTSGMLYIFVTFDITRNEKKPA